MAMAIRMETDWQLEIEMDQVDSLADSWADSWTEKSAKHNKSMAENVSLVLIGRIGRKNAAASGSTLCDNGANPFTADETQVTTEEGQQEKREADE